MLINALIVKDGKAEIKTVSFEKFLEAIIPGHPESYNDAVAKAEV